MTSPNDLTTFTVVASYLADGTSAVTDPLGNISRLISQLSQRVLSHLQRASFISQTFTDTFSGRGERSHFMEQWPVTSIVSVSADGQTITPSPSAGGPGWLLQPWDGTLPGQQQAITLEGYCWNRGRQNCVVTYKAGYLVAGEVLTIPGSPYRAAVAQPQGPWLADGGVVYALTGDALVRVATGTVPTVGQYALDPSVAGGYVFAAADTGVGVLASYSFVPFDINEAVIEWVAERYKQRGRIGAKSQSLGGQTTESYDRSAIPDYIRDQLEPYRRVLPI